MNEPIYYQKEDVIPAARGLWQDILQQICHLDSRYFNKKHQPCPHCGGNDRFRWSDKVQEPGDGGAICSNCGASDGIGWMVKLTGESFSECVNIVGRHLNRIPQEYRVKMNRRASVEPGYKFGAAAMPDKCDQVLSRCELMITTPQSRFSSIINDQGFLVGVKNGAVTHVNRMHLVASDGLSPEVCNLHFVDESGRESFYARKLTFGAVSQTNQTDKTIYLVTDWLTAAHADFAMRKKEMSDNGDLILGDGQEIWNCFTPENLEICASRYKGDRKMRVICRPDDKQTIYMADERDLQILLPDERGIQYGLQKTLYSARDLI